MKRIVGYLPWLALLAFPLLEVGAHAATRARVPSAQDYRAAAAFVRGQFRPGDLIVAAPAWTDPIVRQVLGDRIDLAMAGRSDSVRYERLWALSIRGALPPEAPRGEPAERRSFGRVEVLRWELGRSPVVYDFVERLTQVKDGDVTFTGPGGTGSCARKKSPRGRGGGLGVGVLAPELRFNCEPGLRGVWVGQVVMEDLELQPRYCVYQPPAGRDTLRVTYRDVDLGDELLLHAGLYYEHERMRQGGPITLRVLVGGRELGKLVHRDGDGWKPLRLKVQGRADVAIEVSGSEPRRRHFCWAGYTRSGGGR